MRLEEFAKTLNEGGNVFPDTVAIKPNYVQEIISSIKALLPSYAMQPNIGSAGFKTVPAGDMDIFLDADDVIAKMQAADEKDAKQKLSAYFKSKGIDSAVKGRNVHIRYPLPDGTFGQVDLMVIPNAESVAPWHQHGPRGSYSDPEFKGSDIFILMNSIAKPLGLKFDAFGGKLMRRDDNTVVASDRDAVAKILLDKGATAADLNSAKSMLSRLKLDPRRDEKLAQARQDAEKGILTLKPEALA
jgi:hypothetical protein